MTPTQSTHAPPNRHLLRWSAAAATLTVALWPRGQSAADYLLSPGGAIRRIDPPVVFRDAAHVRQGLAPYLAATGRPPARRTDVRPFG